jgi:DNA-damage-inducible protein J
LSKKELSYSEIECSTNKPQKEIEFMALDTTVRARIDSNLKKEVEEILEEIGLTISQAIILFMNRVRSERGIPFDLKIPSDSTQKAIDEIKRGDVVRYTSDDPIAEQMKDLKS